MRVIKGKYGLDRNCWFPMMLGTGTVSRLWRDICSLGSSITPLGYLIRDDFGVKVNDGRSTIF